MYRKLIVFVVRAIIIMLCVGSFVLAIIAVRARFYQRNDYELWL